MSYIEFPKLRPHPSKDDAWKQTALHADDAEASLRAQEHIPYCELAITTNYTFLVGGSHPEEYVQRAHALGHVAAAIADTNSLAGIVRAHVAAKTLGMPCAIGCRVVVDVGQRYPAFSQTKEASAATPRHLDTLTPSSSAAFLVFPSSRAAYSTLSHMLTVGKRRAPKGQCSLSMHDLLEHIDGQLIIALPPPVIDEEYMQLLAGLKHAVAASAAKGAGSAVHDTALWIGVAPSYSQHGESRMHQVQALAAMLALPIAAHNDVLYHDPARRPLHDVLTCIRHGCTIDQAGTRLQVNAMRHQRSGADMLKLLAPLGSSARAAVDATVEIARRASMFSLDQLKYEYPSECTEDQTPTQLLHTRVEAGCVQRYGSQVPCKVREQIAYELAMIAELGYEAYFLTCEEIVRFARSRGILCQGRGGAANSAVCFVLGITEVDPAKFSLLFERFISRERREPPDIDIDFEHERREEVIQHIYAKYGRDHAALTAEVITYRGRSAVREVGKALGLSLDAIAALAKSMDYWGEAVNMDTLRTQGHKQFAASGEPGLTARVLTLAQQLIGFPRHLSQHVGGFVITRQPLHELVPIENAAMEDRTVIEWDKDDIDAMGMLKIDVLGLGMLTCVGKAFALVNEQKVPRCQGAEVSRENQDAIASPLRRVSDVPWHDTATYDMICAADTIGVFQIESRAQMSMLPRLRPRCFYDLVIEVAIVRPGPIQGGMVHPYLRRRSGQDPITYPSEAVREVLERTLGVPLFQEQAMRLAIVAAGFTPDQADGLRRAMASWKRKGDLIYRYGSKLMEGMLANGYPREFAERCFDQIKGFSEYGFPESHAASFALLVYASSWLKCHHPAAFAAALINSQPMGFYAPAQIVRDAKDHGVRVLGVDVCESGWDCTIEGCRERGREDLRLGLRLVRGLSRIEAEAVARVAREHRKQLVATMAPARMMHALWRGSNVRVRALRLLAKADAFASLGLSRQQALWHVRALKDEVLPLFDMPQQALQEQPSTCKGAEVSSEEVASRRAEQALDTSLPPIPPALQVLQDYSAMGLSMKAHPMQFARPKLRTLEVRSNVSSKANSKAGSSNRTISKASTLRNAELLPDGARIAIAGLVLVRQRPSTASGVLFVTLEDETGIANLIVWPKVYEQYKAVARLSAALLATGRVQRQGEIVHVIVRKLASIDSLLAGHRTGSRDFR